MSLPRVYDVKLLAFQDKLIILGLYANMRYLYYSRLLRTGKHQMGGIARDSASGSWLISIESGPQGVFDCILFIHNRLDQWAKKVLEVST